MRFMLMCLGLWFAFLAGWGLRGEVANEWRLWDQMKIDMYYRASEQCTEDLDKATALLDSAADMLDDAIELAQCGTPL